MANLILYILSALFLLYALLMAIYTFGWVKLKSTTKTAATQTFQTKVSVIIPARNEAANIGNCLQSILQNNFPESLLEIIVINDFSTDNTFQIAREILKPQNGRALNLENYISPSEKLNSYKKKALSIAISEAKGALIITTDADCICPPNWLSEIVNLYEQKKAKAIVAPVAFLPAGKKSMLYFLQSLDFMTMQGITAASASQHLGSMCNGANFAFDKKAFYQVGGYKGIDAIASGDDMLLLYKIKKAFPNGVNYLKSPEAIVRTPCQPDWKSFFNQRIRWASKSDKYDEKILTFILGMVYLFNLGLFITFLFFLFLPQIGMSLLYIFILKIIVEMIFLSPVAKFYGKRAELFWFPLLQPLHILYVISVGFLGLFGSYQWKDRKVK